MLLTFSQLPNKYIISFLNIETQKKQNPGKKFIKSGHTETQKKQNTEKKNSSNPIKLREEGREREATGFDLEARSHGGGEGKIERRWSRSLLDQRGAIGAGMGRRTLVSISAV